jgi:hypothetical protein
MLSARPAHRAARPGGYLTRPGSRLAPIVLCLCLLASAGMTQPPRAPLTGAELSQKQAILLGILHLTAQLEDELKSKQAELQSPQAEGRQDELLQQIKTLVGRLSQLRRDLDEVASGVDLDLFKTQVDSDPDWQKRLYDLLGPLMNELIRLTARPREIEQLRTQSQRYQEQLRVVGRALDSISGLLTAHPDTALVPSLRQLQEDWESRRQDITTQLSIVGQQLSEKLNEQEPLWESLRGLFQIFFRSRGRNFLVASLAFLTFWLLSHQLRRWIQRLSQRRRGGPTFSARLFNVLFTVLTGVGATFTFLLVLYLFEDWILLTVAILFLVGIAWTSKDILPRLLSEATLLLNLGSVREGERLIRNGIPWCVQSLNFFARLVNPELTGGHIRLPLRDLLDLRSRVFESSEPWFPTRTDDWVLIEGQTLAKVALQTPEIVRLVLLGGSRRTYTTTDFIGLSPTVLSAGFRLAVQFGLDYQHQAAVTEEIPARLSSHLHASLEKAGYAGQLTSLRVEFEEAAASSLNIRILADFTGEAAPNYYTLQRLLQRLSVEACTESGWDIPFSQLTLHVAAAADQPPPSSPRGEPPASGAEMSHLPR